MVRELKVNDFIQLMADYGTAVLRADGTAKNMNPIMLWGAPGIGKSQAMKQAGNMICNRLSTNEKPKKLVFTDVRLINYCITDLIGIPVPNEERTKAVWLKPEILDMDTSEDTLNILILDEISACPPSVQAAAYQIVLDRQIGGHKLPDNCFVMCAGNRVSDKSVAFKMSKALANRLMHMDIEAEFEDWKGWALSKGIDPRIMAYLKTYEDKLFKFDANADENAFATPRSWEKVDNILKSMSSIDRAQPLISGCIGDAMGYDFVTWTKVFDEIPSVEDIVAGKKDVKVPNRPDSNFALISSIVSKVNKFDVKELQNLLGYSNRLPSEYRTLLYQDMVRAGGEDLKLKLVKCNNMDQFVKETKSIKQLESSLF